MIVRGRRFKEMVYVGEIEKVFDTFDEQEWDAKEFVAQEGFDGAEIMCDIDFKKKRATVYDMT